MNAVEQAKTAYGSVNRPTRMPKSIEFEAIGRITRNLKKAADAKPANYSALALALHENRRLWVFLGSSVSEADNKLPDEVRARIGFLADFCIEHTSRVLKSEADCNILIEVNLALMAGLQKTELS